MAFNLSRFAFGFDDPNPTTANAAYANTDVNTVAGSGRSHAIVSHVHPVTGRLNQTVVWYRIDGRIMTARRELQEGGSWGSWAYAVGRLGTPNDDHNFLSIGIDGAGILWFSGNMHTSSTLKTWRGANPDDITISEFQGVIAVPGSPFESSTTYPAFTMLPDGDMRFSFRHGGSGSGGQIMYHYSLDDEEWSSTHGIEQPWIGVWGGTGISYINNAYLGRIQFDASDNLHVCWLIRETVQSQTAHDIHYAWQPAGTTEWRTIGGTLLETPIVTTGTGLPTLAWEIPQMGGLLRAPTLAVKPDGTPIIVAYWGTPYVQLHVVSHDGEEWFEHQIGEETGEVSWVGTNPEILPQRWRLGTPFPIERDGKTHVFVRSESKGDAVTAYSNFDGTLSTWDESTVYPVDCGDMDPVHFDDELRKLTGDEGRIHMVQGFCNAYGEITGTTIQRSRSLSVLEFDLPEEQPASGDEKTAEADIMIALPAMFASGDPASFSSAAEADIVIGVPGLLSQLAFGRSTPRGRPSATLAVGGPTRPRATVQ